MKRGVYVCPSGKLLQTTGTVHDGRTLLYRASKRDCNVCPIRAKCCTTADARKFEEAAAQAGPALSAAIVHHLGRSLRSAGFIIEVGAPR